MSRHLRRMPPMLAVLAAGPALCAADGAWVDRDDGYRAADREVHLGVLTPLVTIGNFRMPPGGDLTALDQHVEIHPKGMVGGGWDSNPDNSSDAQGSATLSGMVGADSVLALSPGTELRLNALYGREVFTARRDDDQTSYDLDLSASSYGRVLYVVGAGQLERDNDRQPDTGEAVPKSRATASGVVGGSWPSLRTYLITEVWRSRFLEDGRNFEAADRSSDAARLIVGVSHPLSDRAAVRVRGGVERRAYDTSASFNDSRGAWLAFGGYLRLAPRTGFDVEVGPMVRRYSDDFRHDPAFDDATVRGVTGTATIDWEWQERNPLELVLRNDLVDSERSNAVQVLRADLAQTIAPMERWFIELKAGVQYAISSGAAAGQDVNRRFDRIVEAALVARLGQGVMAAWRTSFTDSRSAQSGDFTRLTSGVELGMVF